MVERLSAVTTRGLMLEVRAVHVVEWYRSLSNLERLAVNCFLRTGDDRLIVFLRERSERLKCFSYHAAPDGTYQLTLHWG